MYVRNFNFGEEAYPEDTLGQSSSVKLEQACLAVHGTVEAGTFSLKEALALYEVSIEDYRAYNKSALTTRHYL
ncbi:hypothetical protein [Pedobacter duraquae]|uniref:Uncharacterized protein n=1 Tax=Pedobacter duraquae TaxID=425511 RepID=A0A4R6IPI6_9SPHI|nr:hypothetical protein [Pedobacter duraquae]TDO24214.1 hypothetical protein CLV32_0503 [Pedobacter duraquae]